MWTLILTLVYANYGVSVTSVPGFVTDGACRASSRQLVGWEA